MKILKIEFSNIGLFTEGLIFDFTATDRVADPSYVTKIKDRVYTQQIVGIAGINASGKSTALKLLKCAFDIVVGGKSLDQLVIPKNIIVDQSQISVDFILDGTIYRVDSVVELKHSTISDSGATYNYKSERLYQKQLKRVTTKKSLYDFKDQDLLYDRDKLNKDAVAFLKPTDSILFAVTRDAETYYGDMIDDTNFNMYLVKGSAPMPLINLFDDSILEIDLTDESLKVTFKADTSEYEYVNPVNAQQVLSSGTIKGGNLIFKVTKALRTGGYLLIDEIENHMHKDLVLATLSLFADIDINKLGATLVFTTHYSEILDAMERKDNIYITLKNDDYSCSLIKFSDAVQRNDVKKSEIFLSNYIDETAPTYECIMNVRKYIWQE